MSLPRLGLGLVGASLQPGILGGWSQGSSCPPAWPSGAGAALPAVLGATLSCLPAWGFRAEGSGEYSGGPGLVGGLWAPVGEGGWEVWVPWADGAVQLRSSLPKPPGHLPPMFMALTLGQLMSPPELQFLSSPHLAW